MYIGSSKELKATTSKKKKANKFYHNKDRIPQKKSFVGPSITLNKGEESRFVSCSMGALSGNFYPEGLAVRMKSRYYHNSANYMCQADIDALINAPKVYVENFQKGNKIVNLSMQFNRTNKKPKVYFSNNIEYYASVVDGHVHLFAVTYTSKLGINSVSLSYLPRGKVEDAIFLARICKHPNEHINKLNGKKIESQTLHIHKASEEFYKYIFEKKRGKSPLAFARAFVDPDAEVLEFENGHENVKDIAKEMFGLHRHKKINIYNGKDMAYSMKKEINRELEK